MSTLTSFRDGSLGGGPNMSAMKDGSLGSGPNMAAMRDGSLGSLNMQSYQNGSLGRLNMQSFKDGSLGCGCQMKGLGEDDTSPLKTAGVGLGLVALVYLLTQSIK